jgi:hypothetical protein
LKLPEETNHSFIVRIWLVPAADERGRISWLGQITHVPDGKRRYLRSLSGVSDFIAPYLLAMGVRSSLPWRLTTWLRRRK